MCTSLRIKGAIDRAEPDPTSPFDTMRSWIGMVTVYWYDESGPLCTWTTGRTAAILKVATGCGEGYPGWGAHVASLRWIGDQPPVEVARAVHDLIVDGGPAKRELAGTWSSHRRTETQHSYRAVSA